MTRKCVACGKVFTVSRTRKKYCSDECAKSIKYYYYARREYNGKETICWTCKNACGGCSWSKRFEPVKGWKAKKTKIKTGRTANGVKKFYYEDSFIVLKCPEYAKDERKGK